MTCDITAYTYDLIVRNDTLIVAMITVVFVGLSLAILKLNMEVEQLKKRKKR
jgi:hypothetical protein